MSWDWEQAHQYFVEAEVQLPTPLWLEAEFNKEVRVVGWQLQAVIRCERTVEAGRRTELACTIQDLGIRGATVRGDQGIAQPVLDEVDRLLTDSTMTIELRDDGRVMHYELELPKRNIRTRRRNQTVRLLLRPFVVGLELEDSPKHEETWFFSQSQLCQMPSMWGTLAPVQGISVGKLRNDTMLEVASSARGVMSPGENRNLVTCQMTRRSFFEVDVGLVSQEWEMVGELTPGSPGADGFNTIPYTQMGRIQRCTSCPQVFATEEYMPARVPSNVLSDGPPPGFTQ